MSGAAQVPVVALENVHKSFGPVHALSGATVSVMPGECIGLVGHNGAGKSTLVNVMNGRLTPTKGMLQFKTQDGTMATDAHAAGIRSVFQELSLCPNLTVAENLRIPYQKMPRKRWRERARSLVVAALDDVFPDHGISANAIVGDLTIAERQMVEIAISFSKRDQDARLVILDEPTSSLDAAIAAQLLAYINRFCADGGAVVFITHVMGEIFEVATRIIVMRDGQITANKPSQDFTHETLVDEMGHVVAGGESSSAVRNTTFGAQVLKLPSGLSARSGEIVGLAGLAGHGQAEALANFYITQTSTWHAQRAPKVAFVAGDRARDGVMPIWSVLRNLSLATLPEFSRRWLVDRQKEQELAKDWHDKIAIKTDSLTDLILSLSGGNQQKVLFARALASSAPIVVMDDPMRGVDIGTKRQVYRMLREEAAKGRTFLWYSTETEEVLSCDRVFVFRENQISAELTGAQITEEQMLRASFEMQGATR